MLLIRARHEGRNIDESHERDIKAVAEADETRTLVGRIDLERSCDAVRLVGHDTHGLSIDTCKADDDILGKVSGYFHETSVINKCGNDITDIVSGLRIRRHDLGDTFT